VPSDHRNNPYPHCVWYPQDVDPYSIPRTKDGQVVPWGFGKYQMARQRIQFKWVAGQLSINHLQPKSIFFSKTHPRKLKVKAAKCDAGHQVQQQMPTINSDSAACNAKAASDCITRDHPGTVCLQCARREGHEHGQG
jgi:hypothetical protein